MGDVQAAVVLEVRGRLIQTWGNSNSSLLSAKCFEQSMIISMSLSVHSVRSLRFAFGNSAFCATILVASRATECSCTPTISIMSRSSHSRRSSRSRIAFTAVCDEAFRYL